MNTVPFMYHNWRVFVSDKMTYYLRYVEIHFEESKVISI